jgi:valyl-tRNA synthetase
MKTKEEILKEKAGIYQFTDNWTFEDDQKLIKAIHEAMDEYAKQFQYSIYEKVHTAYKDVVIELSKSHCKNIEYQRGELNILRQILNDLNKQ